MFAPFYHNVWNFKFQFVGLFQYAIVGDGFPVPAVHNYEFAPLFGAFVVLYRREAKRLPYIRYRKQIDKPQFTAPWVWCYVGAIQEIEQLSSCFWNVSLINIFKSDHAAWEKAKIIANGIKMPKKSNRSSTHSHITTNKTKDAMQWIFPKTSSRGKNFGCIFIGNSSKYLLL